MDAYINKTQARVTLLKALRFGVLLLLGAYIFCWNKDCIESHHLFFKELTHRKQSNSHGREKRNGITAPTTQQITATVDIVLRVNPPPSDDDLQPLDIVNLLRAAVDNVTVPLEIADDFTLTSWNLTTACYPNSTGGPHKCQCEDLFGWSCDICDNFDTCSNTSTPTCDCIFGIPSFGQFCEPISTLSPCQPQMIEATVDIVLRVNPPPSDDDLQPLDIVNLLRAAVDNVTVPLEIADDFTLTSWNLTTACYPNSTGGRHKCQCEDLFGWSCDICDTFDTCSNTTAPTCDCIFDIPPSGEFCEPISTLSPCRIEPEPPRAGATVDIVLTLSPPQLDDDLQPLDIVDLLRAAVDNVTVPLEIADDFTLTSWNLTTACYPNSTGGRHKCQCEDLFGWSCDICDTFDTCSNTTTPTCDCIFDIPPSGEFCEPISTLSPCRIEPEPPRAGATVDIVLTLSPPQLDDDLQPLDIVDLLRAAVDNVTVPLEIADDFTLTSWNLTTACYPNSTGGRHKCQCEDLFGWSCDICDTFDTCSNTSTPTCDCIFDIPPSGEFCEPISTLSPCRIEPEPPRAGATVDIVLTLSPPQLDDDLQPLDIVDLLRAAVDNVTVPLEIADDFTLTSWNLTTACYPNSTGGRHKCQCEDLFGWSCDICDTFDTCSNTSTPTCDCIFDIPPSGEFCEPISTLSPCRIEPEPPRAGATVDIVLALSPPQLDDDLQPLDIIALLRAAVADVSVLFEISDNLILTNWNLTTACYPNSTGGRECQCEDSFGWSCDICDTFDTCSNTSTPTCDCIFDISLSGNYCEPVSTLSSCPIDGIVLLYNLCCKLTYMLYLETCHIMGRKVILLSLFSFTPTWL
nr:uncharacterized protein LOC125990084 isoform X3 [Syngnathus scovelli]